MKAAMAVKRTRGKSKRYTVRLPDGTVAKPHCETRRLANSTQKDFWYAWRGPPVGAPLIGEKESPQWMACLIAAHAEPAEKKDRRRQAVHAILEVSQGLSNWAIAGAIIDALDELDDAEHAPRSRT